MGKKKSQSKLVRRSVFLGKLHQRKWILKKLILDLENWGYEIMGIVEDFFKMKKFSEEM